MAIARAGAARPYKPVIIGVEHLLETPEDRENLAKTKRYLHQAYKKGARSIGIELLPHELGLVRAGEHQPEMDFFHNIAEYAAKKGMRIIPLQGQRGENLMQAYGSLSRINRLPAGNSAVSIYRKIRARHGYDFLFGPFAKRLEDEDWLRKNLYAAFEESNRFKSPATGKELVRNIKADLARAYIAKWLHHDIMLREIAREKPDVNVVGNAHAERYADLFGIKPKTAVRMESLNPDAFSFGRPSKHEDFNSPEFREFVKKAYRLLTKDKLAQRREARGK